MIQFLLATVLASPVVIDRIAVVAGAQVIKSSDIERDLRITEFLNRQTLDLSPDARRKAAERLIDQALIREEIDNGDYAPATAAEASAMLSEIRRDRYGNSAPRFREALEQVGLTEAQLQKQLLWQLTVLRFIDQRFRPGVLVGDEEIATYYNQHLADLKRRYPRDSSLEALKPEIRNALEGDRINQEFENWLAEVRKQEPIEYRDGAFQ